MHHRAQLDVRRGWIETPDVIHGMGAKDARERSNRIEDAGHAAKREGGRAESNDFDVRGLPVAADDLHRIGGGVLPVVVVVEPLEPRRERRTACHRQKLVIGSPARHIGQSDSG